MQNGIRFMRKEEGYFTVEAALILPVVLLIFTTVLFLSFYIYDRCILEQSAYGAALRGSTNYYQRNEEAYMAAKRGAISLTEGKLVAASSLENEVTVTERSVTVSYRCIVNMPFLSWLSNFTGDAGFTISVAKEVPRSRQVRLIRIFRKSNRLLGIGEM